MTFRRRPACELRDAYRFPGCIPTRTIRGGVADPEARIVTLTRRQMMRTFAALRGGRVARRRKRSRRRQPISRQPHGSIRPFSRQGRAGWNCSDRVSTERSLADLRALLTKYPTSSVTSTIGVCAHAEAYAFLGDTSAMYPYLEKCTSEQSGAFGYYPETLRRHPIYAKFRAQLHFQQIVGSVRALKRSRG